MELAATLMPTWTNINPMAQKAAAARPLRDVHMSIIVVGFQRTRASQSAKFPLDTR